MKKITFLLAILGLLISSCNPTQEVQLQITNPTDQQRDDAIVVLSRDAISETGEIPSRQLPVISREDGTPLPCQLDDTDGDGAWDELFCVLQLGPAEQQNLRLTYASGEDYPSFKARTNLRMGANEPGYPELEKADRLEGITYHNHGRTGEVYQMEGPAWENDLVGFRNYLDQRNGMDIFGKTTREMVLDSVGIAGRQSYHEPDTWGMDVLKVGSSLGSGAIGYMYGDSIYRVGDNGSGSYELLFEGSQRSRFNLSYNNWEVEGNSIDVIHQIEIVAGSRCFESSVTYSGSDISLDLVPGIVNMKSDSLMVVELNTEFSALLTHDDQSEDTTLLAMALMVPNKLLKRYGEAPDEGDGIIQTYYAVLEAKPNEPVPYRFYALWELEDPRWAVVDEVIEFLKSEAESWSNPPEIRFTP